MQSILEKPFDEVISTIQENIVYHNPLPIRRVFIPKPGKQEMRPLGIPACIDKIVQECVRIILEPILEAQFFAHSYGFRPMRDAHMALLRVTDLVHKTGYYWIVEGDIKNYFGTINHNKLLGQLWHLGIRDRRVLMIIKAMLEAGIMDEIEINDIGTVQGGIISSLLANVYLDPFDWKIASAWEDRRRKIPYKKINKGHKMIKDKAKQCPAYLVRYADDWVILTNSEENAILWKERVGAYLRDTLQLELSDEKTRITDLRKTPIEFLGFSYKVVPSKNGRYGYVTRTRPIESRLRAKIDEIRKRIRTLTKQSSREQEIQVIHRVNSQIRGLINYYQVATYVNIAFQRYSWSIMRLARKRMHAIGARDSPANTTTNLVKVHSKYKTQIPVIDEGDQVIGLTSPIFCKWKKGRLKSQTETPFTQKGRDQHTNRTGNRRKRQHPDDLLERHRERKGLGGHATPEVYNFEYFLNRGYTLNRDKGKCVVCSKTLTKETVDFRHKKPNLPLERVNRVHNLQSVCVACYDSKRKKKADRGRSRKYSKKRCKR